ncbi:MAG: ATP-binding protein [Deltaproteobacteria bacterium]|nr:ATP-binding protein [Deltaproteobacteria bacterium]
MNEWQRLIEQGETMHVDFKAAMAWDDNARVELTEDIVAMANVRDGGTILVGVAEGDDGKARVDGVTDEQSASYDPTKICDYVSTYFQPPVSLRVERPEIGGKRVVAIRVQEFEATPVICVKDGPEKVSPSGKKKRAFYEGNLIVRTSAATSEVIRTADDMQALVRLAITKTSDALLTDIRRIIEGSPPKAAASSERFARDLAMWSNALTSRALLWSKEGPGFGCFEMVLLPDLIVGKDMDQPSLRKIVQRAQVQGAGWTLPSCSEDNVTSIQNRPGAIEGTLAIGEYQEIWELHETGAFMYARMLHYLKPTSELVLPFEQVIYFVVLGIWFAQRLYQELEAGRIDYEFRLVGVRGQRLGTFDSFRRVMRDDRRTAEDVISIKGATSVLDLRSAWQPLVEKIVRQIFVLFNLDIPTVAITQRIEELEGKR